MQTLNNHYARIFFLWEGGLVNPLRRDKNEA